MWDADPIEIRTRKTGRYKLFLRSNIVSSPILRCETLQQHFPSPLLRSLTHSTQFHLLLLLPVSSFLSLIQYLHFFLTHLHLSHFVSHLPLFFLLSHLSSFSLPYLIFSLPYRILSHTYMYSIFLLSYLS